MVLLHITVVIVTMALMGIVRIIHLTATAIGAACILALLVWLRHLFVDFRIRRAGGVRAPILAGNLFSGALSFYVCFLG